MTAPTWPDARPTWSRSARCSTGWRRDGRSGWPSPSGIRRPATPAPAGRGSGHSRTRSACSRYQNLLHRHCDLVTIANRSNIVNSFCSGFIQTDNHRLYKTPTYYAQKLYATMAGDRPLKIDSPLPALSVPDLSATLSADGKSVVVLSVNDRPEPIARPLDFTAFGRDGQALEVWTLADTARRRARCHQQLRRARARRPHEVDLRGAIAAIRVRVSAPVADRAEVGGPVEPGNLGSRLCPNPGKLPREDRRTGGPIGLAGTDADHFFGMEEGDP